MTLHPSDEDPSLGTPVAASWMGHPDLLKDTEEWRN